MPGWKIKVPGLPRIRRIARRVRDVFPLTTAGLFALAASTLAILYYGRVRLDHLLLAVGGVGLVLVGIGIVCVGLTTLYVARSAKRASVTITEDPLEAECDVPIATGFRVRRPAWLPLVNVRWTWLEPAAEVTLRRDRGYDREELVAKKRDRFAKIVRRFEIGDVFGLVRVAFRREQLRPGRFAPSVGALAKMHIAHGLSGGDALAHPEGKPVGDYYETRRYGAGDPIRFILWKVFARTRQLLVRAPEMSLSPDRRTIAYLVTGQGDEPAAGAARVAVDVGALGAAWVLGADGIPDSATSRDQAIDVLARSARANPEEGGGLGKFLGRSAQGQGSVSRALVFVPARPGPWLDRVVRASAGPPGEVPRVEFVVCTDGTTDSPSSRSALTRALAKVPDHKDLGTYEELLAVVDALGKTGANVLIADRPGGRVVPARNMRGGL
ncbi:MAG TPA: DUF58 domain-containing protein [Kofleriaceae bacterium]|nr:DUF58 domain-containing protein [Kofleriaceae bacterium]